MLSLESGIARCHGLCEMSLVHSFRNATKRKRGAELFDPWDIYGTMKKSASATSLFHNYPLEVWRAKRLQSSSKAGYRVTL